MSRITIAIIALLLLAAVFVTMNATDWLFAYTVTSHIDPVTASTRRCLTWRGMSQGQVSVDRSAIEDWIVAHEGAYVSTWYCLTSQRRNIFGSVVRRGCSPSPPIYALKGEFAARFVKHSSDAEIAEFVGVMRHGTEANQQDAVNRAVARVIEAMSREPLPRECGG